MPLGPTPHLTDDETSYQRREDEQPKVIQLVVEEPGFWLLVQYIFLASLGGGEKGRDSGG